MSDKYLIKVQQIADRYQIESIIVMQKIMDAYESMNKRYSCSHIVDLLYANGYMDIYNLEKELCNLDNSTLFYQIHANEIQYFQPFLPSPELYDENYMIQNDIDEILQYDNRYTLQVQKIANNFGYDLHINEPYFAGFGSNSIVYFVYKDNHRYVLKYLFGDANNSDRIADEMRGYSNINETILKKYIPQIYITHYNYDENYGIIISDYVGITLQNFMKTNPPSEIKIDICNQLNKLKKDMKKVKIYHQDLHDNNITILLNPLTIKIIDLEEIKPKQDLYKFKRVIKNYCN